MARGRTATARRVSPQDPAPLASRGEALAHAAPGRLGRPRLGDRPTEAPRTWRRASRRADQANAVGWPGWTYDERVPGPRGNHAGGSARPPRHAPVLHRAAGKCQQRSRIRAGRPGGARPRTRAGGGCHRRAAPGDHLHQWRDGVRQPGRARRGACHGEPRPASGDHGDRAPRRSRDLPRPRAPWVHGHLPSGRHPGDRGPGRRAKGAQAGHRAHLGDGREQRDRHASARGGDRAPRTRAEHSVPHRRNAARRSRSRACGRDPGGLALDVGPQTVRPQGGRRALRARGHAPLPDAAGWQPRAGPAGRDGERAGDCGARSGVTDRPRRDGATA